MFAYFKQSYANSPRPNTVTVYYLQDSWLDVDMLYSPLNPAISSQVPGKQGKERDIRQ